MAVTGEHQQSTRGPAHPSYVFRGHAARIHSVQILRRNTCLISGDADGWVVYWKLETKRPLAVWRAHDAAMLGTAEWGPDKIVTHGRDNTLRIWQLKDEGSSFSTDLPADGVDVHRPKPWLLHSLPVNTLNFCAFSMCFETSSIDAHRKRIEKSQNRSSDRVYIAVPGRDDKKIEVYQLPDEKLLCVVPRIEPSDTGMVMAVKLVHHRPSNNILVLSGYESGFTAVHMIPHSAAAIRRTTLDLAETVYLSRPHTQPVLSVDATPDGSTYFTSSADAIIAAHRVPELPPNTHVETVEDDEQCATNLSTVELAAHGAVSTLAEQGAADSEPSLPNLSTITTEESINPEATAPNPLDFSKRSIPQTNDPSTTRPTGLSSLLSTTAVPSAHNSPPIPTTISIQPAHKTNNTAHAGQQSLRVRSDGRLIATAGWDSRVRIYSTKTLKEVAVLKWHNEGIYAVDFGQVLGKEDLALGGTSGDVETGEGEVQRRETGLAKLQRHRVEAGQLKHWVVAGAKDGKVSLWEVF